MPSLNVQTNVPVDGVVTSGILKEASKAVANIIGKPESVCLISSLFFALLFGGGASCVFLLHGQSFGIGWFQFGFLRVSMCS
jgi:hypothetical protein